MGTNRKFLALALVVCALALVPVALAAGLTIKTTPTHPRRGAKVEMKISGLKPNERITAVELIADGQQKTTYHPSHRASSGGIFINTVRAQIKGKHTWTYTGRQSHRKGSTSYIVK